MSFTALLVFGSFIYNTFGLCSWNRAWDPVNNDYEATMNFVNGLWVESIERTVELLNGQPYWKKPLYDNCCSDCDDENFPNTLWLYYYRGDNTGNEAQWIISPFWNTYTSSYAKCGLDLPNPTDVTKCNGNWVFAEDGEPGLNATYILDTAFNFRPGACPQLTCERVQFISDSDDTFVGVYDRATTNDQSSQNVYLQENEASSTGVWYLYFNENIFSWIINTEINTDCSAVTDGSLTSVADIDPWTQSSALNNQSWNYYATDATTETRSIECFGQIPTSDPTASDATGYPSPAPTCGPTGCVETTAIPTVYDRESSTQPTSPTANWPTAPTLGPTSPTGAPTTPTIYNDGCNGLNCQLCTCIFIILAIYRLL